MTLGPNLSRSVLPARTPTSHLTSGYVLCFCLKPSSAFGQHAHLVALQGHYMLSNLLQELAHARDYGRKRIVLDEARLVENPVDRLSRMIKNSFWNSLTRRIDGDGLELICADPKNRSRNANPLIYVPHGEPEMAEYYREV